MINPIKEPEIKITKKHIVTATRIITIAGIIALYILSEFLRASGTGGLITGFSYWCTTVVNAILLCATMVTVRAIRKDKKLAESKDVIDMMGQIETGFNKIIVNGLSTKLDKYLEELNKENKYQTYLRQLKAKLLKIGNKTTPKAIEERKKLNEMLRVPKEEVIKMNIRYKPITVSKLFSAIDGRIVNSNEFDIDTYEKADIGKMVGIRTVGYILFSAFTGTFIVELILGGWSAIYSVLIKIITLLLATNTAMNVADDFVDRNIRTSVQRRFKYLANFINSDEEIKAILQLKEYKKEDTNK